MGGEKLVWLVNVFWLVHRDGYRDKMVDVKELSKKLNAKAKFITFLTAETEEILAKKEDIDIIRQIRVHKQKQGWWSVWPSG